MFDNPFTPQEIEGRLDRLRKALVSRDLDAAVIASPENVFYLTGLDHWGYFAPHLLIVPAEGMPVLVTRAMERVSVEKQVKTASFRGHTDSETAADMAARVLKEMKLAGRSIGFEAWTSGMSYGLGHSLQSQADAQWHDISGVVDDMRLVKSDAEQALMRRAGT